MVFKAVDSLSKNTPKLADLKTLSIKVVGASRPEDVQVKAQLGVVELSWEKPYICSAAEITYGFSVWRREAR